MGERCGAQPAAMADAVARRSFGEEEKNNWELWDLGDFQVVANTCTGDLRHVHGPAAPSQDFGGAFDLHYFQAARYPAPSFDTPGRACAVRDAKPEKR